MLRKKVENGNFRVHGVKSTGNPNNVFLKKINVKVKKKDSSQYWHNMTAARIFLLSNEKNHMFYKYFSNEFKRRSKITQSPLKTISRL